MLKENDQVTDIERVAVVDAAHFAYRAWHAGKDQGLSFMFQDNVDKIYKLEDMDFDRIICAIDAPPYKRKSILPTYKSSREALESGFHETYRRLQEKYIEMGHLVWKHVGAEADDVIASAVKHLVGLGVHVTVVTGDKDLLQLVDDRKNVDVLSVSTWGKLNEQAVYEKLGVLPNEIADYLSLVGDSSDDIPGCPGIGKVAAAKALQENSLDEILTIISDGGVPLHLTERQAKSLVANKETVLMGRELILLDSTLALPFDEIQEERKVTDEEAATVEDVYEPRPRALAAPAGEVSMEPSRGFGTRRGYRMSQEEKNYKIALAKNFHSSGLYKRKFSTPEEIFTIMLLGSELGLAEQVSLNTFHMIEGKPSPAAHLLIALAKRDPDCEYMEMVQEGAGSVTYATKKRSYSKELTFTYTLQDAVDDKMRWAHDKKNQRAMLRKCAGSQAARVWYPEACSGLYSREELGYGEVEE